MSKRSPSKKLHSGMTDMKKRWRVRYPPDEHGYYECWICKKPVGVEVMTLDHVLTVEEWPEYRKQLSNLRPAHRFCNEERAAQRLIKLRRRGILK